MMGKYLYEGWGIRLLSPLEAPLVWLNPSQLKYGYLNLLGLTNPLASIQPKWLQYGAVAGWTKSDTIMWGNTIYDPQGQTIMWGDAYTEDTTIMWGDSVPDSDPR